MARTRAERDELALGVESMVHALAYTLARTNKRFDVEELIQDARIGALQAATSWDPVQGPFRTHAYARVLGEMRDGLRRRDVVSRRSKWDPDDPRLRPQASLNESAGQDAAPRGELLADAQAASPEGVAVDAAYLDWQSSEMAFAMRMLTVQQREVIRSSYWGELNLRQIAEQLGVTESRVCQIRAQALHIMRNCMRTRDELL